MTDGLGNRIAKGQYLWWKDKHVLVRVLDISEAAVIGNDTMPMLTVMVQIPIAGVPQGKEALVDEFLRVVDPAAESRLDAAMMELPSRAQ